MFFEYQLNFKRAYIHVDVFQVYLSMSSFAIEEYSICDIYLTLVNAIYM